MATPVKGKFHSQCGRFVSLSLDRERAALAKNISRNQPLNYVMVYSDRPLRDGQLFQVKFEQTSLIRMSSFDIGVTTRDPQFGLPKDLEEIENSKEFFVYRDGLTKLSHCGIEKKVPFYYHPQTSIGCSIKDGKLFIYSNGEEMGVAREGLDRDLSLIHI